jgi:hypothetical protein
MKVLEAVAGRDGDAKDFKVSLIATNVLVVLMLRSHSKVLNSILKVFSFAAYDTAPAIRTLTSYLRRLEGRWNLPLYTTTLGSP